MPRKPPSGENDDPIRAELLRLRKKAGLSQSQAAERLGVSQQQYWKYETGVTPLRIGTYLRLRQVLGASSHDPAPLSGLSESDQSSYQAESQDNLRDVANILRASVEALTSCIEMIERRNDT